MRERRKARRRVLAVLCLCAIGLAGCGGKGKDPVTVPTLSVSEKGAVTSCLTGTFQKSYYDLDGLEATARDEASRYNEAHPVGEGGAAPVTVERVEMIASTAEAGQASDAETGQEGESGTNLVLVEYRFTDGDTYVDYNKKVFRSDAVFFYGTVEQAKAEGYDLNITLNSVKDGGTALSAEELARMGKKHILIADAKAFIYFPGKAAYLSEGLVMSQEHGTVDALETDGIYYILMK